MAKKEYPGFFYDHKEEAKNKILEFIPRDATIGISGSVTLNEIGLIEAIKAAGNRVFDQYESGLSREDSLELRRLGVQADYYLASPNAISESGELVFFSGYGNRTAGISYGKKLILVSGINKITSDIESALRRAREYATPLNCKRLNYNTPCLKDSVCRREICLFPEYKRMCCQILIIEAEAVLDRLSVFLIGEGLGY